MAHNIQLVRAASGAIYINADGTISPSTANITSTDNVTYTFTGNNYLPVVVNRSNIVINGEGYTLQASSGNGFTLSGVNNVTIKNTTITNGVCGIWLVHSSHDVLSGNNVTANSDNGILLDPSSNYNVLSGNDVTANGGYGIFLVSSSGNVLSGNDVTENGYGIAFVSSSDNVLSSNDVTANSVHGIFLDSSSGNVLSGNNVTSSGSDGVLLSSSSGNVLSGNNVTSSGSDGVLLSSSSGNVLSGNDFAKNGYGIVLLSSSDSNVLSGNDVTGNRWYGIFLDSSSGNVLSGNNVTSSGSDGVLLSSSSGNVLSHNIIASNHWNFGVFGVDLSDFVNYVDTSNLVEGKPMCYLMNQSSVMISPDVYPIGVGYLGLVNCKNVTVQGLTLTKNAQGLLLANTTDSKITNNNVTANEYGIWFGSSSGNRIFHNDFLNNTQQAIESNSTNTWDDGFRSGGNYWSDYALRYLGTSINDSSVIWNAPYVIDAGNIDHYPFVAPFKSFNVAWNEQTYSVDTVSNSSISNVSFNATTNTLSFNVTGINGTTGFCRVAIPTTLMSSDNPDEWTVIVNNRPPIQFSVTNDTGYTYVYFTYHDTTETVKITSINAVPEFQPFMLLPLFMITTLFGATVLKKRQNPKA
jgi:parallel beta-helix repeat protein